MEKNIPFFEVDGKRYEIRRTRYLIAELEKRQNELSFSDEEEIEYQKEQDKRLALEKLSARKDELYEIYLETFDENDKDKYNRACVAYNELVDEISKMGNVSGKRYKQILDFAEQLIIISLQWDMNGKTIRTLDEANAIWSSYVEEVGQNKAVEFVAYAGQYIAGGDEEDNPFVARAKAKAEQQLQMKQGLKKTK